MTSDYMDIGTLASIAKIWVSETEKEALGRDIAPLFDMADALPDTGVIAGAPGGTNGSAVDRTAADCTAACGAADCTTADCTASCGASDETAGAPSAAFNKMVMTIASLREDTPLREIETEVFYGQSPSAGGDGFTIPRLLE